MDIQARIKTQLDQIIDSITDNPEIYQLNQDDAQDENSQKSKSNIRVNSEEEVDQMTAQEIQAARLSGASKKRLQDLIINGLTYIEAKRTVIKDNLIRSQRKQSLNTKEIPKEEIETRNPKRPPKRKRVDFEKLTFKEALISEKVAIVPYGFPIETMDPERLKAVQKAIMEAYEMIRPEGPQVRFMRSTHRPGYLVVTCADATSRAWLKEVVPTLKPWEGAKLGTLVGDKVPRLHTCSLYVPDEDGVRLNADRILTRLRVGNKGLHTKLWTAFGKTPSERGQLWTFSVDQQSMEELERLEMCPYFGMGRIQVRQGKEAIKCDKIEIPSIQSQLPRDIQELE